MKSSHRILFTICAFLCLVGSAAAPAILPASLPGSTALCLAPPPLPCSPLSVCLPNCESDGVSLTTTERTFVTPQLPGMSEAMVIFEDVPSQEVVPLRSVLQLTI